MEGWLKQNNENFFLIIIKEISSKKICGTGDEMIYNKTDEIFLFGKQKFITIQFIHSDTITIFTNSNKLDSIFLKAMQL